MIICPTPAPTTAPTTASPTTPPTPPPTNPPTTPPTPPPTNPPTPAPTNPFGGNVYYSSISAFDACNITSNTLSVTGNDASFCASSIFTSASWTSLPTGTYWIRWIGDTKVMQVFHPSNANTVQRVTGCTECPTPAPTNPPTPSPTNPPTPPPTPPPTTPPTPPPTNPPTPPPTPSPTETPYYYYDVISCFDSNLAVARSLSFNLNGVYSASGACYIIQGITFQQSYDIDIDSANYQGGSCFVSGCGYTPPPVPPPTSGDTYSCEPFVGCYEDPFSSQTLTNCNQSCPQGFE
jgi:hypothetical protein